MRHRVGLELYSCKNCGKPKSLTSEGYCKDCATQWEPASSKYIIVNPNTLDEVVEKTGWASEYLEDRMTEAFDRHCSYLVFRAKGQWMDINIHEQFYIPRVMSALLERMEDT